MLKYSKHNTTTKNMMYGSCFDIRFGGNSETLFFKGLAK